MLTSRFLSYSNFVKWDRIASNGEALMERSGINPQQNTLINKNNGKFEMPIIGGNFNDAQLYLNSNIRYPQYAVERGIQGKVFVQFSINKDGKVDNISIVRGVQESLDFEVCRVVHSMQVLRSAQLDGKNIDIVMTLPVTFRLQ